jgi:hypothetical protein
MTTIEIIKKLRASTFTDQDGENYKLDFQPALTEDELRSLATRFPSGTIPNELSEIL